MLFDLQSPPMPDNSQNRRLHFVPLSERKAIVARRDLWSVYSKMYGLYIALATFVRCFFDWCWSFVKLAKTPRPVIAHLDPFARDIGSPEGRLLPLPVAASAASGCESRNPSLCL